MDYEYEYDYNHWIWTNSAEIELIMNVHCVFRSLWRNGIDDFKYLSVFAWLTLNFFVFLFSISWSFEFEGNICFNLSIFRQSLANFRHIFSLLKTNDQSVHRKWDVLPVSSLCLAWVVLATCCQGWGSDMDKQQTSDLIHFPIRLKYSTSRFRFKWILSFSSSDSIILLCLEKSDPCECVTQGPVNSQS